MIDSYTKKWCGLWWAAVIIMVGVTVAVTVCPALAHKVNVFAYVEGGQIKGEGYFAGGEQARQCVVELVDTQGKVVSIARTDEQGRFAMPVPAGGASPLRVLLRASQGHQGEYTLGAGEMGAKAEAVTTHGDKGAREVAPHASSNIGDRDLEERLARLLDQRLQPLTAQVARLGAERGVTVQDVVGGLGYILGLIGLAAFLKARQRG